MKHSKSHVEASSTNVLEATWIICISSDFLLGLGSILTVVSTVLKQRYFDFFGQSFRCGSSPIRVALDMSFHEPPSKKIWRLTFL
jgi:hypothetical protein